MRIGCFGLLAAALALAAPARAADKVTIGFVTTLSGPGGVIGKHMKDGADLALEMLGGKLGGVPAAIIYGDDQFKPDVGRQVSEEMLKKDHVDFVSGFIWSNVMLAAYAPIIRSGTILVGANAGPHEMAGAQCAPQLLLDLLAERPDPRGDGPISQHRQGRRRRPRRRGLSDGADYAAGRDMVAGFKRFYKGPIKAEVFTKPGQSDYQVEISQIRAAGPKAVFVFYPGGMGIQFVKQFAQSGLRDRIPLYSAFTVDETTLPAIGEAALGNYEVSFWAPDLDVPRNKESSPPSARSITTSRPITPPRASTRSP